MKKLITGIIIGIIISTGTLTLATSTVKLIMVPEYIGNHKTVDLLEYVARIKDNEPKKKELKPKVKDINNRKVKETLTSTNA